MKNFTAHLHCANQDRSSYWAIFLALVIIPIHHRLQKSSAGINRCYFYHCRGRLLHTSALLLYTCLPLAHPSPFQPQTLISLTEIPAYVSCVNIIPSHPTIKFILTSLSSNNNLKSLVIVLYSFYKLKHILEFVFHTSF